MNCSDAHNGAPVLKVLGLKKSFEGKTVVDALGFQCDVGRIFSILGPNGAGKTTTVKMLYGILAPDAGQILYQGVDFGRCRSEVKRNLGVCSQNDTLDYDITVRQNLEVFGAYFRMGRKESRRRAAHLLEQFGLEEHATFIPRALSGGLKRRLQIARALMNSPRVLFLDEPTTGLDPHARRSLWDRLHGLRRSGISILLTTHYMEEAETLSDRTVILDHGRLISEGSPRELVRQQIGGKILQIDEDDRIVEWLEGEGVPFFRGYGRLAVEVDREILSGITTRFRLDDFEVRSPNLEDVFVKLTGKSL